ncbi:FAD-binding oxidoreductase [Paraburkholderia diazotrophica]|uniref:FAD/FMN-containing dehydrogenase n=1 Tax=Paraburkholderia diazotrophica TaxID=667676 RepID=A0A1H7DM58_9BURK|nr:FAD-binding oxidoreductase [Paraburkholderia diazotrophica]SEK01957.1 FAD/FMN-containing dehydrogenase [Paraburkholderia diazotrophica]
MHAQDTDALHLALVEALGADCVSLDAAVAEAHAGDWSDAPRMRPRMTLLPRTPEDVARALRVLAKHRQAVVVQGGLTGLTGGATPQAGEVALSLARVNAIESFDRIGGTLTVQAGVPLEQLQTFVKAEGWFFPLDLGARGTCQIGGNAATNAGGNRVIRFGTMRELILGLEVALPDGTMLSMMNRVTKNTTGVDLKQLFIGSEGMLGVITRIVLKLEPKPSTANTALCAVASFDDAARLLKYLRARLASLSSFELMWQDFMSAAMDIAHLKAPFGDAYPAYALVETLGESDDDDRRALEQSLERMLEEGIVQDVIIAQTIDHAKQLWAYRETVGELLSKLKPHAAFDIGIPMDRMERLVEDARASLSERFPQQTHLFFGHLGDGNLHLLSGPYADATDLLQVEELIYAAVSKAEGCISAEHGIGVIKGPFLHYSRSEPEIELMKKLKALLDPTGILNAGRVMK